MQLTGESQTQNTHSSQLFQVPDLLDYSFSDQLSHSCPLPACPSLFIHCLLLVNKEVPLPLIG